MGAFDMIPSGSVSVIMGVLCAGPVAADSMLMKTVCVGRAEDLARRSCLFDGPRTVVGLTDKCGGNVTRDYMVEATSHGTKTAPTTAPDRATASTRAARGAGVPRAVKQREYAINNTGNAETHTILRAQDDRT